MSFEFVLHTLIAENIVELRSMLINLDKFDHINLQDLQDRSLTYKMCTKIRK